METSGEDSLQKRAAKRISYFSENLAWHLYLK